MQTCRSVVTPTPAQRSRPISNATLPPVRNTQSVREYQRPQPTTELPYLLSHAIEREIPVDCVLSDWSQWSVCSASCGDGIRTQQRRVLVQPRNGGQQCGRQLRRRRCNNQSC